MTTNPTPVLRLSRPLFNSSTWHDDVNDNATILDGALASIGILSNIRGVWANNTLYEVEDRVASTTGLGLWANQVEHTSPATGTFIEYLTANPGSWRPVTGGIVPRGAWAAATIYKLNDVAFVADRGLAIIAVVDHTSGVDIDVDIAAGKWFVIIDFSDIANTDAELDAAVALAEASAVAAQTAETNAETAETNAETAAAAAATSATAAQTAETNAETAETNAEAAQAAAELARTNAQTAETNAETAETNAETAETNAETAAAAAAASATAAQTAETNAETAETNAETAQAAAAASATAAQTAETNAETAETNAETAATAAAASAAAAAASVVEAQGILDDITATFDSGSWTPGLEINGSAAGITLLSAFGTYNKIGPSVFGNFSIILSEKGAGSGIVAITGLPFEGVGVFTHGSCFISAFSWITGLTTIITGQQENGGTRIFLQYTSNSEARTVELDSSQLADDSMLSGFFHYTTTE